MKLINTTIFLFFSSFLFAQQTYYVANAADGGSDLNAGTLDSPFESLAQAFAQLGPGDSLLIRGGNYQESVFVDNLEGTIDQPINIASYPGERVIMDGTIDLSPSDWMLHADNVYKTTITEDIWQLFVDGKEQVMARWPNAQLSDDSVYDRELAWAKGTDNLDDNGLMINDPLEGQDLSSLPFSIEGALVIANVGSFKTYTRFVNTHIQGEQTFNYDSIPNNAYRDKHHYYFLEGKLDLLDTENEWFFDKETKELFVYAESIEALEGKMFRGKTRSFSFEIQNSSFVDFSGLHFFASTVYLEECTYSGFKDCLFAFPNYSKRMLGSTGVPQVTQIEHSPNLEDSYCYFNSCLFEYTDGEALRLDGKGNKIINNYFHHIDWSCGSINALQVSIYGNGTENLFEKNTIHKTGASSTLLPGRASTVRYNDFYDTGYVQSDGAIIQCTNSNVADSEIAYNWIHDSKKYGIRYDAPVGDPSSAGSNGLLHHNVVWNLGNGGMMVKGDYQAIYNNTCFNNLKNDIIILDEDGVNMNSETKNNLADKISGHRNNSYDQNPVPGIYEDNWNGYLENGTVTEMLVNAESYDFAPIEGSAVIDQAQMINGITDVFVGLAPEQGAYELGDSWSAGVDWEPDFYPWEELIDTSLKIAEQAKILNCFPNPTTGVLFLQSEDGLGHVRIFDLDGKLVMSRNVGLQKRLDLNISQLPVGTYLLISEAMKGGLSRTLIQRK